MEREFKLGDVFEIASPKKRFDANKIKFGGKYPYVARGSANNGIRGYIDEDVQYLSPANSLSFGQDTATVFFQPDAYFTGDKIKVMILKDRDLTPTLANYLIASIAKAFSGFVWGQTSFNEKILQSTLISLPVVPSADPAHVYTPADIDWGCMERCIAELEEERVAELEAYLEATGLDDCELTPQDEQTLAEEPPFAKFRVGDVMQVDQTKSVVAKKDLIDGAIPYVTRTVSDNGYTSSCGNADRINLGNCITIGAETGVAFYQPNGFVAGNKVYRLSRDGLEAKQYLYLTGVLNKQTSSYSYSNARIPERIRAERISLPVVPSADPAHVYTPADIDWGYMERYIRATEKLVMADVVAYKDRVIAETRRIVHAPDSRATPAEGEAVA